MIESYVGECCPGEANLPFSTDPEKRAIVIEACLALGYFKWGPDGKLISTLTPAKFDPEVAAKLTNQGYVIIPIISRSLEDLVKAGINIDHSAFKGKETNILTTPSYPRQVAICRVGDPRLKSMSYYGAVGFTLQPNKEAIKAFPGTKVAQLQASDWVQILNGSFADRFNGVVVVAHGDMSLTNPNDFVYVTRIENDNNKPPITKVSYFERNGFMVGLKAYSVIEPV